MMRNFFGVAALAMSVGLAGIGHNMPPAPVPLPYAEQMQISPRIKRADNKKLWQKRRRKPKQLDRYHRLSWSQRKGRLFKGHRP